MKIINVVGARPNFMKIAPIMRALKQHPDIFEPILVHTGQHYDSQLSESFFKTLDIPQPDINLEVGSASHAVQTAKIMADFEKVLDQEKPDLVVVVGDVNSTVACTLTAVKKWIPVAHIEAGLRSRDRRMPEEINRIVTDSLSDYLFTTSVDADENLLQEGVPSDRIFFVGNVMIDTLLTQRERALTLPTLEQLHLEKKQYALLTLHRPSNVDHQEILSGIIDALESVQEQITIVFPIHPRTRKSLKDFGLLSRLENLPNLRSITPVNYLEMLNLMANAQMVLSDSGGIQEETTILGVPCLTLRENTERPVTVIEGTNLIIGNDPQRIVAECSQILAGEGKQGRVPKLWDGRAAERIADILRMQQDQIQTGLKQQ